MMKSTIVAAVFCFSAFFGTQAARAGTYDHWESAAGGCVPINTAIQGNWYQDVTGYGRVKHNSTYTNTIYLVCPITGVLGNGYYDVTVYYQDQDTDDDNYVQADLKGFDKSDGTYNSHCSVRSDNSGTWESKTTTAYDCGTVNTSGEFLWVLVTIKRTDTNNIVEFNGVSVDLH